MSNVDIDFDYVDYDKETKHAHLVVIESGFDDKSVWLPKSQIKIDDKNQVIEMPEWLALEKELI